MRQTIYSIARDPELSYRFHSGRVARLSDFNHINPSGASFLWVSTKKSAPSSADGPLKLTLLEWDFYLCWRRGDAGSIRSVRRPDESRHTHPPLRSVHAFELPKQFMNPLYDFYPGSFPMVCGRTERSGSVV